MITPEHIKRIVAAEDAPSARCARELLKSARAAALDESLIESLDAYADAAGWAEESAETARTAKKDAQEIWKRVIAAAVHEPDMADAGLGVTVCPAEEPAKRNVFDKFLKSRDMADLPANESKGARAVERAYNQAVERARGDWTLAAALNAVTDDLMRATADGYLSYCEAYNQGRKAAEREDSPATCPYDAGSAEESWWLEGHKDGKEDAA